MEVMKAQALPQLHVTTNLGGADSMTFNQLEPDFVQLSMVIKYTLLEVILVILVKSK